MQIFHKIKYNLKGYIMSLLCYEDFLSSDLIKTFISVLMEICVLVFLTFFLFLCKYPVVGNPIKQVKINEEILITDYPVLML